jgi:hypothetical protein
MSKPPLTDRLRARLEEHGVDERVGEIVSQTEDAVGRGVARAGELTHEHRDRIDGVLDRASGRLDLRTDGRYADQISRARTRLDRRVDRLVERRPESDA